MPKILLFDVLGTVVDWCSVKSVVAREAGAFLNRNGAPHVDPADFAAAWASRADGPAQEIRSGIRPFISLDVINYENLRATFQQFNLDPAAFAEHELHDLNTAWHRLEPWPDSSQGLALLRKRFVVAPLSDGNTSMLIEMAKHGHLGWDTIMGSDVLGVYKPDPRAYLGMASLLGAEPQEVMLVAAHNGDLAAARRCGLLTAFVPRPDEHSPRPSPDLVPTEAWDFAARDLVHLAEILK